MDVPRSTYRLQITPDLPLRAAAGQLDYLRRLGADWVYLSPLLEATIGSDHGYDVVDHSRTDAARGGRDGLRELSDRAHALGLGVLVDIVPNHVGIAVPRESVWWWDVLTHGRESVHARAFDIDWEAGGGRVRIPVLGDGDEDLDWLRVDDDRLWYYDHAFPIAPGTSGGTPREVHARQHYELVDFRRADSELNYRRFFAVNTLAGIRVEEPEVFDASHREISHWIESGWVDGLRVDHPDGLADPAEYLRRLASLAGGRYTVVEKILEPGEELPTGWACAGTTGYDTLALVDRLLVDPAGEGPLTALDTVLRGERGDYAELVRRSKRAVAEGILGSEVARLVRLLSRFLDLPADPDSAAIPGVSADLAGAAVAELAANLAVYRTYLPVGMRSLFDALVESRSRRPDLADALQLVSAHASSPGSEFATRFEQTSGAVMAKGVEDCAFYRYPRLTSLTEVGGDPSIFACSPDEFYAAQQRRLAAWPASMTTLSTHDTKRGEDVRARIDVLAEIADEWAAVAADWLGRTEFPDPVLGNLLLQTAVGAWPIERERLHAYAEKAAREAGNSTGWITPDAEFERELHALVDALYDDAAVERDLTALAGRLRPAGWSNSLAAKLIQLTLPGVPDVYRGTELWRNDLVDPDNRRPFDPAEPGGAADLLERLDAGWLPDLDASGAAKLLVTSRALRARRDRPDLFTGYRPLAPTGPASGHLVAFDRGGAITLATRLPMGLASRGGWASTTLELPPGRYADALTGSEFGGPVSGGPTVIPVSDLIRRYPVALLLRAE